MSNTSRAVVRDGKIELLEPLDIPDGTEVLVTILRERAEFWAGVTRSSLTAIWDNETDEVYARLLDRTS